MIVMFSGGIASGKTTLSRRVASALGCKWASFGDFIRTEAERRNLPLSREVLQDLGQSLVDADVLQFCLNFLAAQEWSPRENLIVDGLRHLEVLSAMKRLAGDVRLIFVYADFNTREARLATRGEIDLHKLESHVVEEQNEGPLREESQLIVDSRSPIEENISTVLKMIS